MGKISTSSTYLAIAGYSVCSSTLLLANKVAIAVLPHPSTISFIQIVMTIFAVFVLKRAGISVDQLEWSKIKVYIIYVSAFVAAIYANMQALSQSNVETVIVFRSCCPIAVSLIEYLFMGRAWPSVRSSVSLLLVAVGAVAYCLSDSEFELNGFKAFSWVSLYFALITFEMTYGKKLTSTVKMHSVWGPVLYTNVLAVFPMFMFAYFSGEFEGLREHLLELPLSGLLVIVFSCVVATLIGYTGWYCRGLVSAATYTLVGVVKKFITLLLNVMVWDKHASSVGLSAVCLCLLAGTFYQEAPLIADAKTHDTEDKS